MFEKINPKHNERLERRYKELQSNSAVFLSRFDFDKDGYLNEDEERAAKSILLREILDEESRCTRLDDAKLEPTEILKKRFQIVHEIGNGSQGVVYIARDLTNKSLVIVKQLRLSHLDTWETYDAFQREAKVLSGLSHPKLPGFIDAFEIERTGKWFYFSVQSYLPGKNLAQCLDDNRLFSEIDIVSIGRQCLEILTYLHNNIPSVLHRDIKPSNILLDEMGQIYLVDFGAVQYASTSRTIAIGTSGYMAAEQMSGSAQPASDLYCLGATLIRLATRRQPDELELHHLKMVWRPFTSLSDEVCDWIDKLIEPEFEDRFQDASAAKAFLENKKRTPITPSKAKLPLNLLEIHEAKPPKSTIQLWESVDQFVCTFDKTTPKKRTLANVTSGMMDSLLDINNFKILSTNGGGFSFDGNAKCKISSLGTELLHRKLSKIEKEYFDDGNAGLIGVYERQLIGLVETTPENSTLVTRVCLIVGLSEPELEWVSARLAIFLSSHNLYLM